MKYTYTPYKYSLKEKNGKSKEIISNKSFHCWKDLFKKHENFRALKHPFQILEVAIHAIDYIKCAHTICNYKIDFDSNKNKKFVKRFPGFPVKKLYDAIMSKIPHFEIVRASRRSISIHISPSKGLMVRAPFSVPEDIIRAFVERKSDWIRKHLITHIERLNQENNVLYYLGQIHSREYNLLQKEAIVHSEGFFTFSSKVRDISSEYTVLNNWYRKQARSFMIGRVTHFAKKYELTYEQIRITSANTRWGSCSGKNNLNFPWRLMMAPREVIDYVIVHELSHTIHKNHSPHFWNLVESIMPDWKIHRAHLREEGWKYSLSQV